MTKLLGTDLTTASKDGGSGLDISRISYRTKLAVLVITGLVCGCFASPNVGARKYEIYHIPHEILVYMAVTEGVLDKGSTYRFRTASNTFDSLFANPQRFVERPGIGLEELDIRTKIVSKSDGQVVHIGFSRDPSCDVALVLNRKRVSCDNNLYDSILLEVTEIIRTRKLRKRLLSGF